MKYLSLFTGVGGLESEAVAPSLCCELDDTCHAVLRRRFGGDIPIHDDVKTLDPPSVDVVAGGWPCQDISVAGLRRGLAGERSGLFFELLRVAIASGAHTLIAENVPNLLVMEGGDVFRGVLDAIGLERRGDGSPAFPYIAWRTLNARSFGLPHQRERVFIIASRYREIAVAIHRRIPEIQDSNDVTAAGFYWTAGLQSICYSKGFVPTLKVGSALSIPSPPALHFDDHVRKATPEECLGFQGFHAADFLDLSPKEIYRVTGNAVAVPVGRWVFASLTAPQTGDPVMEARQEMLFDDSIANVPIAKDGLYDCGRLRRVFNTGGKLTTCLNRFIDTRNTSRLSGRAAAGLLNRLRQSGKPCPDELLRLLHSCAEQIASTDTEDGEFDPTDIDGDGESRSLFATGTTPI